MNTQPTLTTEQIILEKLEVAAQQALSPQLFAALDIELFMDDMIEQMVMRLKTYVMAERVNTETISVSYLEPTNWWQHWKQDCLAGWLARRFPPKTKRITKEFLIKDYYTFPENTLRFPPELGPTVRVLQAAPLGGATWPH